MTDTEKLVMIKTMLQIEQSDTGEDALISVYIFAAAKEIIGWRYSYSAKYVDITEVPAEYEMTQISAVVSGYSQIGAENQTSHSENGIGRSFKYEDMIAYIRNHVVPIAGVIEK